MTVRCIVGMFMQESNTFSPQETAYAAFASQVLLEGQAGLDSLAGSQQEVAASVYTVQPWLDLRDTGSAAIVVTDGDDEDADALARGLVEELWARRRAFEVELIPPREAVRRALALGRGPVVLSETADGPSGGAAGDGADVVAALLEEQLSGPALASVVDPPAVARCWAAGMGAQVTLAVGGTLDPAFHRPVSLHGVVEHLGEGRFTYRAPGYAGLPGNMGRIAVVRAGLVLVLLMELPPFHIDPEVYRRAGLDPQAASIVVVKSALQFRAAYAPFAAAIMLVDTPGPTSARFSALPWRHLPRPFSPLDDSPLDGSAGPSA